MNFSRQLANPVKKEDRVEDRILLIVEDDPGVTRLVFRVLKPYFRRIYLAEGPSQAVLVMDSIAVTHMVVDQNYGNREITGDEFLHSCRSRCPSILAAVIYTGSDLGSLLRYEEIDAVVSKTARFDELTSALGLLEKIPAN